MKVAFSVWRDRISPVFDSSETAVVMDLEDGKVESTQSQDLSGLAPEGKLAKLCDCEVCTLICGAISRQALQEATARGIETIPFVAGDFEVVLEAFLAGDILRPSLVMPGCGNRRRCGMRHGGRPGRRGGPNRP